jgi:DNA repair exonuclease SbcCD ATPase subunit
MSGFRRVLFGYRRTEVEDAISQRDARVLGLELTVDKQWASLSELENETTSLHGMVLERERELRTLNERLREANECHDRSIASLDAITSRLEEVEAQARGQATRIRMKALREAVEVSKKVKELTEIEPALRAETEAQAAADLAAADSDEGLYEGEVKLEIGPLGDFSQLGGFEDAVGQLGASEIKVDRFSEGRATFSMQLDEPTDLLSELEELSSLDFKVRHTAPDNLILDVDEESGPEQRAA